MSVINDMLQDLEQRRYRAADKGDTRLIDGLPVATAGVAGTRVWWWMGLVLCLAASGVGWGYATLVSSEPVVAKLTTQELPSPAIPTLPFEQADGAVAGQTASIPEPMEPVAGEPPVSLPLLERIGLRQDGESWLVELEFARPMEVPLLHYRRGDRLWLRLLRADRPRFQLPDLTRHSPIKEWQTYLEDGYQMLTLRVESTYAEELQQVGPSHWCLRLQPPAETVKSEALEPGPTTTPHEPAVRSANSLRKPEVVSGLPVVTTRPVRKAINKVHAAARALAKGRGGDAERLLKEVLEQEPGQLAASLLLSEYYLASNAPVQAEPVILSALAGHPDQAELVNRFARCLLAQDRVAEAGEYLSRSMRVDYASHAGLLASIRQRQNQHRQARDYYLQALRLQPGEAAWLAGLGISQEHLGDPAAAGVAYDQALATGKLTLTLKEFVEERLTQLKRSRL